MDTIAIEFTREEAITLRFLCGGAAQNQSVTPPARLAAQEALGKIDAALTAPPVTVPEQAARQPKQK
jgi:hypothetical protein